MANGNHCPKCNGIMREGFVIDHGDHQYKQRQTWVEGEPEESFWSGLKTKGRQTFNVRSRRCAVCGYLEFYATDEVDSSSIFS